MKNIFARRGQLGTPQSALILAIPYGHFLFMQFIYYNLDTLQYQDLSGNILIPVRDPKPLGMKIINGVAMIKYRVI